jgi:hypothetical protein
VVGDLDVDALELFRHEEGRRATPEMELDDPPARIDAFGDGVDLTLEMVEIARPRVAALRHDRVAAAEETEASAER